MLLGLSILNNYDVAPLIGDPPLADPPLAKPPLADPPRGAIEYA